MARPRSKWPAASLRRKRSGWQVYWRRGGRFFSIGIGEREADEAELMRMEVAIALKGREWPGWALDCPAVKAYCRTGNAPVDDDALVRDYAAKMQAAASERWMTCAMRYIANARAFVGKPLAEVTPEDADRFLTHVLTTGGAHRKTLTTRTPGTRNRYLAACRKFFRWAVETRGFEGNPFAHVQAMKEERPAADITYCTAAEREAVLAAARPHRDNLAVWFAFYAGLRRREIAALEWRDIGWEAGRVIVRTTKTGVGRVLPLATTLRRRLERSTLSPGPPRAKGRIAPWPAARAEWEWAAESLIAALREEASGVAPEHIGWTPFRHTFASMLAQAGVSLDKISAWMGNSPEVCRRHYAQFVPRGAHDEDIDKL